MENNSILVTSHISRLYGLGVGMSGTETVSIEKLRKEHQSLAVAVAEGTVPGDSFKRVDRLRESPAFVELVATKRAGAREAGK